MNGDLTFNSIDLQTYNPSTDVGIITNVIDHTDGPDMLMGLYGLADADGSSIPAINYPSKPVALAGAIKGSSQADLDNRIDTFKGYFTGKDKNLDITYGSGTRRYIATAGVPKIQRKPRSFIAIFQVPIVCTNPFGLDTSTTDLWAIKNNFTSATFTETPTVGGNAPYQLPIFTITIDAFTGAGDYVQISNDNNNQEILIYGLGLEAGDVVVIDCVQRIVTVNGNEVDYYGTFLELEPGANSITYTDGFTTRTVDVAASYTKRWL
jgi:adenylate cyclase class IV